MRDFLWLLMGMFIAVVTIFSCVPPPAKPQQWDSCVERAGYVYVVDTKACVPFNALVPAR